MEINNSIEINNNFNITNNTAFDLDRHNENLTQLMICTMAIQHLIVGEFIHI